MSRVITNILRIVWATRQTNAKLVIAANVFVNAGVLMLYIVNLAFAIRMLMSAVPSKRLEKIIHKGAIPFFVVIVLMLGALIATVIQSSYTLNANIHRIDRDVQLSATTYFLVFAVAPLPTVAVATYLRNEETHKPFGSGSWNAKLYRVVITSLLATFIAGFRAGATWATPRPTSDPAWYQAKWCLYVFNFVLEIVIVYIFLFSRVDHHFHIPKTTDNDDEKAAHPQFYTIGSNGNWNAVKESDVESQHGLEVDQRRIGMAISSQESLESEKEKY